VELNFVYAWVLPEHMAWEISPTYSWEYDDSDGISRTVDYEDEFSLDFITATWEFGFEKKSSFGYSLSDNEHLSWEHTFTTTAVRDLTPNIVFDADYEYKFDGEGENTDKVETNLEWAYRDTTLTFKFINDRSFEDAKDVVRTAEIEFQMDF
jgi:hypothetical protein